MNRPEDPRAGRAIDRQGSLRLAALTCCALWTGCVHLDFDGLNRLGPAFEDLDRFANSMRKLQAFPRWSTDEPNRAPDEAAPTTQDRAPLPNPPCPSNALPSSPWERNLNRQPRRRSRAKSEPMAPKARPFALPDLPNLSELGKISGLGRDVRGLSRSLEQVGETAESLRVLAETADSLGPSSKQARRK